MGMQCILGQKVVPTAVATVDAGLATVKELIPVVLAVAFWGRDNSAMVAVLNDS